MRIPQRMSQLIMAQELPMLRYFTIMSLPQSSIQFVYCTFKNMVPGTGSMYQLMDTWKIHDYMMNSGFDSPVLKIKVKKNPQNPNWQKIYQDLYKRAYSWFGTTGPLTCSSKGPPIHQHLSDIYAVVPCGKQWKTSDKLRQVPFHYSLTTLYMIFIY